MPESELAVCLKYDLIMVKEFIITYTMLDFAHGKVDPSEAGKSGGQASGGTGSGSSGGDNYKPTEHGGQTKDGGVDGRVKQ